MPETQYRCKHCGEIHDRKPLPGWCCVVDGHPVGMEPVVVLPLVEFAVDGVELAAWRKLEPELTALRALKARVEDDKLIDDAVDRGRVANDHPTYCVCYSCSEDVARERGAADYRAALREGKR